MAAPATGSAAVDVAASAHSDSAGLAPAGGLAGAGPVAGSAAPLQGDPAGPPGVRPDVAIAAPPTLAEDLGQDEADVLAVPPRPGKQGLHGGSGGLGRSKASTVEGVLKSFASRDAPLHGPATFMTSTSGFKASPKFTLGARGTSTFIRSSSTPAPGSYDLPESDKDKCKTVPRYSFGVSSRFGLGQAPHRMTPGPGSHDPADPTLKCQVKPGFGTSMRGKGAPLGQANPGPGAYEFRTSVGEGRMFTARGRLSTSYLRSKSEPGPGAYQPTTNFTSLASPKCGFGTSTRGELASRTSAGQPGPGAYELHQYKCLGKDGKKFSATSRRRMHDLNSYVTPGPGSYHSHTTSFGY